MAAGGPFAQPNPQVSSENAVASYQPQVPRPSSANSPKSLSGMATAGTKYANGAQMPRTFIAPGSNPATLSFPLSSLSMQQGQVAERQAVDSMPPQTNWSDVFDQLDNNGDGVISRKEFDDFLRSQQQLPPQTLDNPGITQVNQHQNVIGSTQSFQAQGQQQLPPQTLNILGNTQVNQSQNFMGSIQSCQAQGQQQLPPQTLNQLGDTQVNQSQNFMGSIQSCQAQGQQQLPPQTLNNLGDTEVAVGSMPSMQGSQAPGYVLQSMNFASLQASPRSMDAPSRLTSTVQEVPASQARYLGTKVVTSQQEIPRSVAFAASGAQYQPSNPDFTFENVPTSIQSMPSPAGAQPWYSSQLPTRQVSAAAQPLSSYHQAKVITVVPASSVPLYGAAPVRQPVRTVAEENIFPDFSLRDLMPEMRGDSGEYTRSCYNAPIEHLSSGMPCLLVSEQAPMPITRNTADVVPVAGLWSCADLFGHNSSIPPLLLHEDLPAPTQRFGVVHSHMSVPASEPFVTHATNHVDMIEAVEDPYAIPQLLCAPSVFAG